MKAIVSHRRLVHSTGDRAGATGSQRIKKIKKFKKNQGKIKNRTQAIKKSKEEGGGRKDEEADRGHRGPNESRKSRASSISNYIRKMYQIIPN